MQRFAIFHDAGIRSLYGGIGKSEVLALKGIGPTEDWLNRFSSAELAAHYFRITQTEESMKRERVNTEHHAIETHAKVGREVRAAMKRSSGVAPEELPAALTKRLRRQAHGDLLTEGQRKPSGGSD